MKENKNLQTMKKLLENLIRENNIDMQNYLSEFLDKVEEDTHFLYNLQHCRELHYKYHEILNLIELLKNDEH